MVLVPAIKSMPALRFAFSNERLEGLVRRLSAGEISDVSISDVAEIAAIKTNGGEQRSRRLVLSNGDEKVAHALVRAFTAEPPQASIEVLTQLKGIGVATASAILCWVRPQEWPVIDVRSWNALATLGLVSRKVGSVFRPTDYATFIDHLQPAAASLGWPARDVDRWLYAFDKAGLRKEHLELGDGDKNAVTKGDKIH